MLLKSFMLVSIAIWLQLHHLTVHWLLTLRHMILLNLVHLDLVIHRWYIYGNLGLNRSVIGVILAVSRIQIFIGLRPVKLMFFPNLPAFLIQDVRYSLLVVPLMLCKFLPLVWSELVGWLPIVPKVDQLLDHHIASFCLFTILFFGKTLTFLSQ